MGEAFRAERFRLGARSSVPGGRCRQGLCVIGGKSPNFGSCLRFLCRRPGFGFSMFFGCMLTKKGRREETGWKGGGKEGGVSGF